MIYMRCFSRLYAPAVFFPQAEGKTGDAAFSPQIWSDASIGRPTAVQLVDTSKVQPAAGQIVQMVSAQLSARSKVQSVTGQFVQPTAAQIAPKYSAFAFRQRRREMSEIGQTGLDIGGLYKFLLYYHRFQILDSRSPKSTICVVAECANHDFRLAASKIRQFSEDWTRDLNRQPMAGEIRQTPSGELSDGRVRTARSRRRKTNRLGGRSRTLRPVHPCRHQRIGHGLHQELLVNCPERTGGYFMKIHCISTKNDFAGGGLLLGIASRLHQIASVWCEPKQGDAAA